jgi:hypothetical protein
MTQDEVLATLHKVVAENMNYTTWTVSTPHLVALVNLAVEQERESCAKVCDEYDNGRHANAADLCATAIRARGSS